MSLSLNLNLDTTIEMEGKKKKKGLPLCSSPTTPPIGGDDVDDDNIAKVEEGQTFEVLQVGGGIDRVSERSYVWKLDCYLLPFLSLMYFFNSVDRSNLGNAKTDGIDTDLHFKGNEYSLLILLFYIPFGLCDLPLNLLTKLWSGRIMLPTLMVTWGSLALLQCAAKNFAGLLVIRLFLGACEAGFFAGVVFYLTLFYTRPELGFRLALFFGSALLAAAFSGLISYGVFRITNTSIPGWKYLFIIEGSMTVLVGLVAFWWLPASPSSAWFLNGEEKKVAEKRMLRDGSRVVGTGFSLRAAFRGWRERPGRFLVWCAVAFTYPVAFSTTSNFLPQIVARLGYSTIKTNLWTVAPNAVGFITLLAICKSSDHFRERTYHIIFSLLLSLLGMIILASIDVLAHKNIAYFACFLMAAGSYIPSVLVHSWHNNNNLDENSRAATTGFLVGLGNLAGILSAATFRVEFAPGYRPTLVATAACNVVCIVLVAGLGGWMKVQNRRRDRLMGISSGGAGARVYVDTERLDEGEDSPEWRFFT